MQASCPQCHKTYRITQALLEASQGLVRCGHCGREFRLAMPEAHDKEENDIAEQQTVPAIKTQADPEINQADPADTTAEEVSQAVVPDAPDVSASVSDDYFDGEWGVQRLDADELAAVQQEWEASMKPSEGLQQVGTVGDHDESHEEKPRETSSRDATDAERDSKMADSSAAVDAPALSQTENTVSPVKEKADTEDNGGEPRETEQPAAFAKLENVELDADEVLALHMRHLRSLDNSDTSIDLDTKSDAEDATQSEDAASEEVSTEEVSTNEKADSEIDTADTLSQAAENEMDDQSETAQQIELDTSSEEVFEENQEADSTRKSTLFPGGVDNNGEDEIESRLKAHLQEEAEETLADDRIAEQDLVSNEDDRLFDFSTKHEDQDVGGDLEPLTNQDNAYQGNEEDDMAEDEQEDHVSDIKKGDELAEALSPEEDSEVPDDEATLHEKLHEQIPPPAEIATRSQTKQFGWVWLSVLIIGLAGLFFQLSGRGLSQLVQNPVLQPIAKPLCEKLGCEIAPRYDLTQLEIVTSRLRKVLNPDPQNTQQAIKVSMFVVNHADFPQAYPDITLTLTNQAGEALGRRTYDVRTYLNQPEGELPTIDPGKLGGVSLLLADPPEDVVGYELAIAGMPVESTKPATE